MLHYAPSPSAVARSRPYPTGQRTILCLCCGDTMKHFRTVAKLGVRPERFIFVCPSCNGVDSRELKQVA